MTFDTGDFPVGGCLPRVDVNLHVVTDTTERGGLRKLESGDDKDNNAKEHEGKEDHDALLVRDRTLLRFAPEVS